MNDNDVFLAMLQGMQPDQTQALAQRLRGQDLFGKVYGASLDPNAQRMGGVLSQEAQGHAKTLGEAAAQRKYRDEMQQLQRDQMARADERFGIEQTYREKKDEEDRALKRALAELRASTTTGQMDRSLQSLSREYRKENVPQLKQAFTELNEVVSPFLDEQGNLKDGLPGIGATGLLPAGMLTEEGKTVRSKVANVRNQVLRMMSGAAVTDPEAARLYEQIGEYLGGTDEQVLMGLRALQNMAERNEAAVLAGYSPDVVDVFTRRMAGERVGSPAAGGTTGTSISGPAYMFDPANATLEQMLQMMMEQEDNQ